MGEKAVQSVQSQEYDLLLRMLRSAREEAGVSQRQLSKLLGRASSYVSKIENGTRRLDVLELFHLLTSLGLDLPAFLGVYANQLLRT